MTTIPLKPKQSPASPRLTLSDFTEVVSKAGSPKATKVSQIKNRDDYHPAKDMHKPLKDGIVKLHQQNGQKKDLKLILSGLSDPKKQANYPEAITGYQKWWGKKELKWFQPPSTNYSHDGVDVIVKPELGLYINDQPHIIKLHLRNAQLHKPRANLVAALLELTLRNQAPEGAIIGVLDVRHSRLYSFTEDMKLFHGMIDAELSYVATMWDKV